jgi:hypothetical protein
LDSVGLHGLLYEIAFLEQDEAGMQRELQWASANPGGYQVLNLAAAAAAFHGKLGNARQLFAESLALSQSGDFKEAASWSVAGEALFEAEFGNFARARERARASARLSSDQALSFVAVALAFTGDANQAQNFINELDRRLPLETELHSVLFPCTLAVIESNHNHPNKAIETLQAAKRYELGTDFGFLPIYVRGLIYQRAGQGNEAAAFRKILDHRVST